MEEFKFREQSKIIEEGTIEYVVRSEKDKSIVKRYLKKCLKVKKITKILNKEKNERANVQYVVSCIEYSDVLDYREKQTILNNSKKAKTILKQEICNRSIFEKYYDENEFCFYNSFDFLNKLSKIEIENQTILEINKIDFKNFEDNILLEREAIREKNIKDGIIKNQISDMISRIISDNIEKLESIDCEFKGYAYSEFKNKIGYILY